MPEPPAPPVSHDPRLDAAMAPRVAASVAGGAHRMTVGLRPLAPGDWIEEAPDHDEQLAEKRRLLATRGDVLAALPGSGAAGAELLDRLARHLPRHLPHRYRSVDGATLALGHPGGADDAPGDAAALARAARLVTEDLCLLAADAAGRYRLVAAALCFPTRWRLHDKLGEPMDVIHAPVPGYRDTVAAATDRVLAALAPGRALWRANWSLLDSPALYQPVRLALERPHDPAALGARLWLRSERQTLSRLPASGHVVFTIRIRQCRLDSACRVAGLAARLAVQVRSMPPALKAYKALTEVDAPLLAYLDAAAA